MATRTLIDGSTDLTQASSWSGATIPITGDDVVIPRGRQHIDTFSLAGVRLESLEIAFNGRIETTSGAALAVDVDNSTDSIAKISGTGATLRLSGGTTNGKWENTLINSPGSLVAFTNGEFEDMTVESGTVILDSSATFDNMNILGGSVTLADVASAAGTCNHRAGTLHIHRPGEYNVYGGSVVLDVTVAGTTTINLYGGSLTHVNGDFGGEIHGMYMDALEQAATIDTVIISSLARIRSTNRVTWSNVTEQGMTVALPLIGSI